MRARVCVKEVDIGETGGWLFSYIIGSAKLKHFSINIDIKHWLMMQLDSMWGNGDTSKNKKKTLPRES